MVSIVFLICILVFLSLYAGLIVLQVFLSKRENKFVGLIIPIVQFLLATLVTVSNFMYGSLTATSSYPAETIIMTPAEVTTGATIALALLFVLANIPTIISLLIYFVCRQSMRRKKQLDKLNVQDLD